MCTLLLVQQGGGNVVEKGQLGRIGNILSREKDALLLRRSERCTVQVRRNAPLRLQGVAAKGVYLFFKHLSCVQELDGSGSLAFQRAENAAESTEGLFKIEAVGPDGEGVEFVSVAGSAVGVPVVYRFERNLPVT